MSVNLYKHQRLAIGKMDNGKVLKGGVGTGKTRTALAYYTTRVLGRDYIDSLGVVRPKTGGSEHAYASGQSGYVVQGNLSSGTEGTPGSDGDSRSRIRRDAEVHTGGSRAENVGLPGVLGRDEGDGSSDQGLELKAVDIYVITTARKRDSKDWEEEASAFAISTKPEETYWPGEDGTGAVGDASGGVSEDDRVPPVLVVDSWNNVVNYTEVKNAFFIFDEQRLVGSGAWVKAFIKIAKANQWIMLSATPGDTWMDYIPIFVANGWYKNRTEFLRTHAVFSRYTKFPKVERFIEVNRLVKYRNSILVEMPYDRATKRLIKNILVGHDEEKFKRVWIDRWHIYENRPLKDIGEMFTVARKLVNSDPSRLGALMELLEKHPKLIVFYNFDYELFALRTLSDTLVYEVAEWNGHKHEVVPGSDKWLYLAQYTAASEAWNCITTDAMAFYSLNYSWKIYEQSQGRIDRLNTPFTDLHYYVFRSAARIDQLIQKSLSQKKTFNEKSVKW